MAGGTPRASGDGRVECLKATSAAYTPFADSGRATQSSVEYTIGSVEKCATSKLARRAERLGTVELELCQV